MTTAALTVSGVDEDMIRIAVRPPEENELLLDALRELLA